MGEWEITPETQMVISALLIGKMAGIDNDRIVIGRTVLLDGTICRSPAMAEDYLKSLIEREPKNAVLWRKLGNIYLHSDLRPKARNAFTTSIKLNPDDIESHFNLGSIYFDSNKFKQAQEHLHKALVLAHDNRQLPEEKLRDLVSSILDMLFEMSHLTNGEIAPFPDMLSVDKKAISGEETHTIYLTEYNLSDKADWERLVDTIIGKRKGAEILRDPQHSSKIEISRKSQCPCGSGMKYKRCCGK